MRNCECINCWNKTDGIRCCDPLVEGEPKATIVVRQDKRQVFILAPIENCPDSKLQPAAPVRTF